MLVEDIHILASGEKWVGYGVRSFSSTIREVVDDSRNNLLMTIYTISDMKIVESIERALERGVSIEIFIYFPDQSFNNRAINEIVKMEDCYNYLKIYRIRNEVLHAKLLVADGQKIIAGSANPTFSGMVKNYELGFLIEDDQTAHKILTILRRLANV